MAEGRVRRGEQDFRPGSQHPEPWRHDLNPQGMAGQNVGLASPPVSPPRTAYDIKDLHGRLRGFRDDVLQSIPVLPPGTRLRQGARYVDLRSPGWTPFTATADMTADETRWYVAKDSVSYPVWNRLTGVENPERLDQADKE